MYQQLKNLLTNDLSNSIKRIVDNTFIPFDIGNTDYQTFKLELANGASLKDAEGNDMTAEQITAFLQGLA
jgi:hypothetical protein